MDEIIISYPAIKAIEIQRMAHVLYKYDVPFIPRMMTEHAHGLTGIDIHAVTKAADHAVRVMVIKNGEIANHAVGARSKQAIEKLL